MAFRYNETDALILIVFGQSNAHGTKLSEEERIVRRSPMYLAWSVGITRLMA